MSNDVIRLPPLLLLPRGSRIDLVFFNWRMVLLYFLLFNAKIEKGAKQTDDGECVSPV